MDIVVDFDNQESKQNLYKVLKLKKGVHLVKIVRKSKKRSVDQNAYYWGVVLMYIGSEIGYTKEESHEAMGRIFLSYEKANAKTGEIERFVRSTTELSTVEFEEYLEKIRQYCIQELDILIPLPNEVIT